MFFFLHVPKTGGTTLNTTLHDMFAPFAVFHGQIVEEAGGNAEIGRLLAERPDFYDHLMLIVGHYGFRHPLVQRSTRRRVMLAVLRDPIDRIVSIYDYMRYRTDHPHHLTMNRLSLREAVHESPAFQNHSRNAQLQTVFGTKDVKEANRRLRQERYVLGRFDQIPRFIQAVESLSGRRAAEQLPRLNSKPDRLPVVPAREQPDFDQAVLDLRQLNAAEIEFVAGMPPVLITEATR